MLSFIPTNDNNHALLISHINSHHHFKWDGWNDNVSRFHDIHDIHILFFIIVLVNGKEKKQNLLDLLINCLVNDWVGFLSGWTYLVDWSHCPPSDVVSDVDWIVCFGLFDFVGSDVEKLYQRSKSLLVTLMKHSSITK